MCGVRVLVLSADIGEGHVTAARALTGSLGRRDEVDAVELHTDLDVMGRRLGAFLTRGFHTHLDEIGWSYDLAYSVFFEQPLPRLFGHLALAALGQRGLRRTIRAFGPDVIVTEYPLLSGTLGQLRALGRLPVPICSSISDPAGLYYWAHPGIDLHLCSWPESLSEVERIAGPGRAAVVRPVIDKRFLAMPDRAQARSALSLLDAGSLVVVSGGGWGIGDLAGAVTVARRVAPTAIVIALAGRNEDTFAQLSSIHGDDGQVRVVGFSEQMPELLAACDALIHTTGGTTALEARVTGCPLINFGRSVAHVRAHARALADQGVAEWARDRAELATSLARVLRLPRPPPVRIDQLPDAADLVVDVGRRGRELGASRSRMKSAPADFT